MLYVTCLNSWRPSITRVPPTTSVWLPPLIPYLSHKKFLSAPYTSCCFCALVSSSICSHSPQDSSSFPFSFLSTTMTMLLFTLSLSSTLSWIHFPFILYIEWNLDCDLFEDREQVYSAWINISVEYTVNWIEVLKATYHIVHCSCEDPYIYSFIFTWKIHFGNRSFKTPSIVLSLYALIAYLSQEYFID